MRQNPEVVPYDESRYMIRFTRRNWTVLVWIQDLSEPKMKSTLVDRPLVLFSTRNEAERAVADQVIPYLIQRAGEAEDIVGWAVAGLLSKQ